MANFLPPAVIEIKALADKAIAEFKQVNGELDKMEKEADKAGGGISRMEKTSKLATGALIGMGAAFAGFAAIGVKGVIEDEKAFTKLGQTFTNLGINIKANRDLVGELDGAYSKLGFGGDETATALNRLLSTTNDLDKSQALLATSADLARAKNIDLASAASILGRASMGNAKAFKDMGIALDETLPKNEAIAKAFDELNDKIGGQATAYTKTFSGQLVVLKEQISAVADSIGAVILPYLKSMIDTLQKAIEFVKRNSEVFKILAGVVVTITVALAAYNVGVKASIALTKIQTGLLTAQKIATALLTGNQLALNAAMKANPIGLIFTAVTLLIGGFVLLWNKSEPFRKMMISIGKVGLQAFGGLIKIVGVLATGLLKIVTGPMRLLLKGLSLLGVEAADKALKGIEGATNAVGKFIDDAGNKVAGLSKKLDALNKPIRIGGGKGIEVPSIDGKGKKSPKGGISPEEKREIDKKNKEYQNAVKDLNDKVASARKKYDENVAKAQKVHGEKVFEANKKHNQAVATANARFAEADSKARSKAAEEMLEATKRRDEGIIKAEAEASKKRNESQKTFNETMGKLNSKRAEDLAKLEKDNADKVQSIYKANAEKLKNIIQQSIDRLRDAYKGGTSFSVTQMFKDIGEAGKRSADDLLTALKTKLNGAKQLAENASKLAGAGFSQTFIEQVVSAGPEVGNELADSILKATPETITELQKTFSSMEAQTNTGLDHLATAMNKGANLATDELNKAYREAEKELTVFLTEQAKEYANAQVEINKEFTAQMAEAEKTRDEALAAAQEDLTNTLAEINKEFNEKTAQINKELNEALASATKDLNDALADANKDLADALADAAKDLADALEDAKKELADTLAELEKEFAEKLGNIQNATKATISAINALKAAMASAQAASVSSVASPSTGSTTPKVTSQTLGGIAGFKQKEYADAAVVVNQTFNTDYVDPIQVKTQMLNAIKYGSTVETTNKVYSAMHTAAMRAR